MLGKKTKIVCTLGPASNTPEMVEKLAKEGMNIVRCNFSHEDHKTHGERIDMIREVSERIGINLAIMLDTKGPEIRCGIFKDGKADFLKGDIVKICRAEIEGTHERFHIACPELFEDVKAGNYILIDDGKMRLTILENDGQELTCRVENSGTIKTRKGCNVPNVKLSMPFISEKDDADIRFGCEKDVDFIAASFVRRAEDVLAIRKILIEMGKPTIQIIAKIENQEGFDNLESILEVADGVMVARGDLGVEVQTQYVPIYQKTIIHKANEMGKPVITATHMLESMMANPRPTRAERATLQRGSGCSDAIMLSVKARPANIRCEAVRTMATIAEAVEKIIPYRERLDHSIKSSRKTVQDAIGIAVSRCDADAAERRCGCRLHPRRHHGEANLQVQTVRPILAVTFTKSTQRKLEAYWGVTPIFSDIQNELTNDDELASTIAKGYGLKPGQLIIMSAGYPTGEGSANMMKIIEIK